MPDSLLDIIFPPLSIWEHMFRQRFSIAIFSFWTSLLNMSIAPLDKFFSAPSSTSP